MIKKLICMFLIVSLLLPLNTATAATKVASPKITTKVNKTTGKMTYTFKHSNKKAKIYYTTTVGKIPNNKGKYKYVKAGGTITLTFAKVPSYVTAVAYVGNNKSKPVESHTAYVEALDVQYEKAATARLKVLAKEITKDCTTDAEKVIALHEWILKNVNFIGENIFENNRAGGSLASLLYSKKASSRPIAESWKIMCKEIGIKAEVIYSGRNNWIGQNVTKLNGKWYYSSTGKDAEFKTNTNEMSYIYFMNNEYADDYSNNYYGYNCSDGDPFGEYYGPWNPEPPYDPDMDDEEI